MAIASINPASGETIKTFQALGEAEIEQKLQHAVAAAVINRRRSFADRASRMRKAADVLDGRQKEFGRLITLEMGKPIKAAVAEVTKCATVCRYYACLLYTSPSPRD